jgi:hypothetical protein
MTRMNVIDCAIFAREESNTDVSFVVKIVKIYILNYALKYHKKHIWISVDGEVSVTAAIKKNIQKIV